MDKRGRTVVAYTLKDCPKCKAKDSFGNILGCINCTNPKRITLPNLQKKILYLDQSFFSSAFRENDSRFQKAAKRVERLVSLQLLAVPHTNIHEHETHQWKSGPELYEFIKSFSRNTIFKLPFQVELAQIINSFKRWLEGGGNSQYVVERKDAIDNSINKWVNYSQTYRGGYTGNIELIRNTKEEAKINLINLFPEWRKSSRSFNGDLEAEYSAAKKMYWNFYNDFILNTIQGSFDGAMLASVIPNMLLQMPDNISLNEKELKCLEYFNSNYFKETPCQWIKAHIFATLKADIRNGKYSNTARAAEKFQGFFSDVKHIGYYAPYVDAIMIDKAMAELVVKPTIALEKRYGVKVFSVNNWENFFIWLEDIEAAGMTQEHKSRLKSAYPDFIFD